MADRPSLMACGHCDAVYRQRDLAPGERAECARCGVVLSKYSRLDAMAWLALALGALIVFLIANTAPVGSMTMQGFTRQATLLDALVITLRQGKLMVALMTGLSGFLIPLLQLLVLIWILAPLAMGRRPFGFGMAARMAGWLLPWAMVPVFLLSAVVSVVKLADMAAVRPGVGLWAFAALTVMLTMLSRLKPKVLWRLAQETGLAPTPCASQAQTCERDGAGKQGDDQTRLSGCLVCGEVQQMPLLGACRCKRCGAVLRFRRPEPLTRATALLLAAVVLYFPANLYPVMRTDMLLGTVEHTILGGVVELWRRGAWDIALIVFVASVMVPAGKLLALAVLIFLAHRRAPGMARQRTRMYEIVERIGQWSMLDVYVVILLAALADFPGLVQVSAQAGAVFFGLVVILTMLAAMSYDPRLVWDAVPSETPAEPHDVSHPSGADPAVALCATSLPTTSLSTTSLPSASTLP